MLSQSGREPVSELGEPPLFLRRDRRGSLRRPDANDLAREVVMSVLDTRGLVALYLFPDNRVEIVRASVRINGRREFLGHLRERDLSSLVGVYGSGVSRAQVRDDILAMPRGRIQ